MFSMKASQGHIQSLEIYNYTKKVYCIESYIKTALSILRNSVLPDACLKTESSEKITFLPTTR